MSSAPAPHSPQPTDTGAKASDRLIVYRHSNLFYWWPIWLMGFIFAGITYFMDHQFAIVPAGTVAYEKRKVEIDDKGTMDVRDVLILEKDKKLVTHKDDDGNDVIVQPRIFVLPYKTFGSVYAIILLIIITLTNITIRGLWTVFVFVFLTMLTIILAAGGWWEYIFHRLGQLSIYINMGGYLLISIVLFILWFINFAFFDRYTYMVFTPGQVRVRMEIGGEETVYDTTGMVVQKQRDDLFRHWVLGFGSGDLIIKPFGQPNPLEFPNVLFVGAKVKKIETMTKEKVIVRPHHETPPA